MSPSAPASLGRPPRPESFIPGPDTCTGTSPPAGKLFIFLSHASCGRAFMQPRAAAIVGRSLLGACCSPVSCLNLLQTRRNSVGVPGQPC
eukprot:COSAG05_NODE_831_length_7083_cov_166.649055_3_plen_90_part_00